MAQPTTRHLDEKLDERDKPVLVLTLDDPRTASICKALSSTTRLKTLKLVSTNKDIPLSELASLVGVTQPALTKHIEILENAGLVQHEFRKGKRGVAKIARCNVSKIIILFE